MRMKRDCRSAPFYARLRDSFAHTCSGFCGKEKTTHCFMNERAIKCESVRCCIFARREGPGVTGPEHDQDQSTTRTTARPGPQHDQDHSTTRTTARPGPQHDQDHSMTRTTARPGPQHDQDHSMTRTTARLGPLHDQDHSTTRTPARPGPQHDQDPSTTRTTARPHYICSCCGPEILAPQWS